jgi:PTH1 family peptidyl-tRNA hydrolase
VNPPSQSEIKYKDYNRGRRTQQVKIVAAERLGFLTWEEKVKLKLYITDGKIGRHNIIAILPNAFMNNSGGVVKKYVTSKKKAERLIVIYDDIDLPLGRIKINKSRGDGGHNGIASLIKSLQTRDFIRIRVGVSPKVRGSNEPKKPKGEKKVLDYLMSDFKKQEMIALELLSKEVAGAIETIVEDGLDAAMNEYNGTGD